MGKYWDWQPKSFINQNMLGRVGKMILSTQYMSNLHVDIIHHNCKMIQSVINRSTDTKVSEQGLFEFNSSTYSILKHNNSAGCFIYGKANNATRFFTNFIVFMRTHMSWRLFF